MAKSKEEKLEIMKSVLNKLDDVHNTQQSLIEKLGLIQVELFDIQSPDLDKELEKVMDTANETIDIIHQAQENFEIKYNALNLGANS